MSTDNNFNPITIDEHFCNGCGKCVFICPMGVIELLERAGSNKGKAASASKPEYCLLCESCVKICKRGAVTLNDQNDSLFAEQIPDLIPEKKKTGSGIKKEQV